MEDILVGMDKMSISNVNKQSEDNNKQNIISSKDQTKQWRKKQTWYKGGRKTECEIYQRKLCENIISDSVEKSNKRINIISYELINKTRPMINKDGFEWTEDFDGYNDKYKMYINFKMICSDGGAQTRSLRELYHFINVQLNHIMVNNEEKYFVNILDGDCCYKHMNKFNYLISQDKYKKVRKYVFIGDMLLFKEWFVSMKLNTLIIDASVN